MPTNILNQASNTIKNLVNNKMLNKNTKKLSVDEIAPNSGEIIEVGGKKTAVYKNEKGEVTKLNPACTHLGCDVAWNKDDNTWTCPCHGSKYKGTGEVINGPATKPLGLK